MPTSYVRVSAKGDGNCAFNAFILGLCQPDTLNQIERVFKSEKQNIEIALQRFIKKASEILEVTPENFVTLKNELLRLRQNEPEKLQKKLAPILRNLACDLLLKDTTKQENLGVSLLSAYDGFINPGARGVVEDDVFLVHPFIREKFQELKDMTPRLPESEEDLALTIWWRKAGYTKFIAEMRRNAENSGDIELAPLAQYFRLSLQVTRQDRFTYQMYRDYGSLPATVVLDLNEKTREDLYNRGIVDHPSNPEQKQLPLNLDRETLDRRLGAVPDHKTVLAYIESQPEQMKETPVPRTWSTECLDELKERGIICSASEAHGTLKFNMNKEAARNGCIALPAPVCAAILSHSRKEPLPEVLLVNDNAIHWDFMQPDKTTSPDIKPSKMSRNDEKESYPFDELFELPDNDHHEEKALSNKPVQTYEKQLLTLLKDKLADYKGEGNKWERWVKQEITKLEQKTEHPLIENTPPVPGKEVEYTLSEDKKIKMSIDEQIKRDEEYAKKLQSEEYEGMMEAEHLKNKKSPPRM